MDSLRTLRQLDDSLAIANYEVLRPGGVGFGEVKLVAEVTKELLVVKVDAWPLLFRRMARF